MIFRTPTAILDQNMCSFIEVEKRRNDKSRNARICSTADDQKKTSQEETIQFSMRKPANNSRMIAKNAREIKVRISESFLNLFLSLVLKYSHEIYHIL